MLNNINMDSTAINTDRAISDILSNFSDDYIENMVSDSLSYKFRPFNTRMPNIVYVLQEKFRCIYANYTGDNKEQIDQTVNDTYMEIIETICKYYGLRIAAEIPDETLFSLAYVMYQIFVSEFTDRMINMFTDYIMNHIDDLIATMPDKHKIIKTTYAKKLYTNEIQNQNYIIIYDNLDYVLDVVETQDISLYNLLIYLSNPEIATFITSYIVDVGDIYRNCYVSYILDPASKTDMITSIKLKLVAMTAQNAAIIQPENNPCIINDEEHK